MSAYPVRCFVADDAPDFKITADEQQSLVVYTAESAEPELPNTLAVVEGAEAERPAPLAQPARAPARDSSLALKEVPERAQPAQPLGTRKSYQAQRATCGSQVEVLVGKRAFRLAGSCEGSLHGKQMQFKWGEDACAAWTAACNECCSCRPGVWL